MRLSGLVTLLLLGTVLGAEVLQLYPMYGSGRAGSLPEDSKTITSANRPDFSAALDILDQEHIWWAGQTTAGGELPLAHMLLETNETEKALNMQRFKTLLSDVTCAPNSDATIKFKTLGAYSYAIKEWGWVNRHPENTFLLLFDWLGCITSEGNLKPFHFVEVSGDASKLTITLKGAEKEWMEAAHTFTLKIGSASYGNLTAASNADHRPDVPSDYTVYPTDTSDHDRAPVDESKLEIDPITLPSSLLTVDKGFSVNLAKNFGGTFFDSRSIGGGHFGSSDFSLATQCTSCYTSGQIAFNFQFSVKWFALKQLGVNAAAHGVGAQLQWSLDGSGQTPVSFDYSNPLLKVPIGDLGISIGNILTVGMVAKVKVGLGMKGWNGKAHLSQGMRVSIPDGATAYADVIQGVGTSGSWAPQISGSPLTGTGQVNSQVGAYLTSGIGLELKLFKTGFEAALQLKAPWIIFDLQESSQGTCVNGGLDIQVGIKAGKSGDFQLTEPVNKKRGLGGSVGSEYPLAERFLDRAFPDGEDSGATSLHKRDTGVSLNYVIWSHEYPVFSSKCIGKRNSLDRQHPRDLLLD